MAKANTQAPKAENQTKPVNDPAKVAAIVSEETVAEVIARYGMTQEDFDALPEASREALVKAHLAEAEAKTKEAELQAREARVAKAEEAMTSSTAGRFYDPAMDEGKSDDEKRAKYAGVIKTLLNGGAHPMFTIIPTAKVQSNTSVQLVVDLTRGTRFQNRDEAISLVAFTEAAITNNPDDKPEDDPSLERGTALRQTA